MVATNSSKVMVAVILGRPWRVPRAKAIYINVTVVETVIAKIVWRHFGSVPMNARTTPDKRAGSHPTPTPNSGPKVRQISQVADIRPAFPEKPAPRSQKNTGHPTSPPISGPSNANTSMIFTRVHTDPASLQFSGLGFGKDSL